MLSPLFLFLALQGTAVLDAPLPMPETIVVFACEDGSRLTARFRPGSQQVLVEPGGAALVLGRQPAASGFDYASGGARLRGKGAVVEWTASGAARATTCRRVSGS